MREIVEPTVDERGDETHPAWILVGANRVSGTPGAVLFDSDIQHRHYIVVTVARASRRRDLNHDFKFGRKQIFSFAMSEAQWASFVSSMGVGGGVPATLEFDASADHPIVPGMPYSPRLQVSMDEVHGAAEKAEAKVKEAFERYKAKRSAANLRDLEIAIGHMTPNVDYVTKTLIEHAENVVTRARADIEAHVLAKATQLGIEPGDLGTFPELTTGEETTT